MNERELRLLRSLTNEIRALREEINTARKDDKAGDDTTNNKRVQPLSVEITATPQLDPARREYYVAENHDRQSFWRKSKPWVEAIGVVLALFLAVFTLLTLLQIKDQTPAIKRSADAAKSAAETASKQMTSSERAWVGLDGIITLDAFQLTPIFGIESHYTVKNFGNGPAFKVVAHAIPVTDDEAKLFDNYAKLACDGPVRFATGTLMMNPPLKNPGPFGYILFPGQTHEEYIGSPPDPWTGPPMPNLRHFWFVGCIAYLDQFNTVHWTRFCIEPSYIRQSMNRDMRLQFCSRYNDTDEPQK